MKHFILVACVASSLAGCIDLYPDVSASSDGSRIVAAGQGDLSGLFVMAPDGTGFHRLDDQGEAPSVSPDGKRCVYFAPHTGGEGPGTAASPATDYRVVDLETGQGKVLQSWPGAIVAISSWNPDGRSLAVVRVREEGESPVADLVLIDPDTGGVEEVAGDVEPSCAWSPDGQSLAYLGVGDKPEAICSEVVLCALCLRREGKIEVAAILLAPQLYGWLAWLDDHRVAFCSATLPRTRSEPEETFAIHVYDDRTGSIVELFDGAYLQRLALSPDRRRLLGQKFVGDLRCRDLSRSGSQVVTDRYLSTLHFPFWIGNERFGWFTRENVIATVAVTERDQYQESDIVELDLAVLAAAAR